MNKLLLATGNRGKLRELRALLAELASPLVTPDELGLELSVAEDGESYLENAQKKSKAFAAASGLVALADNSGLEVDILDGEPGLHSKRYLSDKDATDGDRRAYLLQILRNKPRPWRARFRAAVAVSAPFGETLWAEGECPGEIIPEEHGQGGFGYDAIFVVDGMGKTMAELDMEHKNRVSHRARAIANAWPILTRLLG